MYVLKDNIDMAGIYDVITRGTAEIYHQEDQNIFLKDLRSGAYMLSVNNPEKGIRWLQERENARYDLMELWQKECAEYCRDRYHLDTIMECRQAVWVKDSIKPLASSDLQIREPDDQEMELIFREYNLIPRDEMMQVRALHNIFVGCLSTGEIAGFIGMHMEGSIGMLEILPAYRRCGYAAELEHFMIQRTLEMGLIPFGQIEVWNEASIALQQKMGMTVSEKSVFWLF